MLFVHYGIALPADYEMARIDARVAAKADHWDRREGLVLKAFTVAERSAGMPHNRYAPFYVWADPEAFTDFLTGPEYAGLSDGFGTVSVHTAQVLALTVGTDPRPRFARWESRPLALGEDPGRVRADEIARHESEIAGGSVSTRVVSLDPRTWTVHRLSLSAAPSGPATDLRVVHLARPAAVVSHR